MNKKLFYFASLFFLVSCASKYTARQTYLNAAHDQFSYTGRSQKINDSTEALISSAAHVFFTTKSDTATVLLGAKGDDHAYAVIEVNGNYYGRFRVKSDSINRIPLSLPKNKNNVVGIFKATEASNGPLLFYGVAASNIEAAKVQTTANIEFIGNSITCGYGADAKEIACHTGTWYDQHNAYLAYGPRAARMLNVGYTLSSVSGMGIYRNWNDEDTKPVMGDVYATTNLDGNKLKPYDFSDKTKPDIVSICLGTNDLSNGDGKTVRKQFDAEKFTAKYIAFVNEIFSLYPNTKVALLTSPMVSAENNSILLSCLQKVKDHFASGHTVAIFQFKPMKPNGCDSHPDVKDHEIMAAQLVPFYAELLKK